MEPDNCSPHLDYTRLLFNKKTKYNNKPTNTSTMSLTSTFGPTANSGQSMEALELMKTLLTSQFENEIMKTCDKYMDLFQKAAGNILANQGEEIPQVCLNSVLQAMLKSTRSAVTRRYSSPNQFNSITRGRKMTRRTIKVARHKPRTLKNLKMDWYKQIRKDYHTQQEGLEEPSMENTAELQTLADIGRPSSPVLENHIDTN